MNRAGDVPRAELRLRPGIDDQGTLLLGPQNSVSVERRKWRQIRQCRRARAVDLGIARKVAGALGQRIRQQMDEVLAARGFQCIVGLAFFADRGETLGADLSPAQRTRAVSRIDASFIAQRQ